MSTVHNPPTPYVGLIPGGLQDGMTIHVTGQPEHHHTGFLVSLQAGGSIDPRSDCAFVFNPRFSDNQVIRNSLMSGSWGAEERHGGFPFQKGRRCDITIHVTPHHYKVSVNGHHHSDYNHRMPKHRVTHITIEQGIKINSIRFEGGYPPQPSPGYPGGPSQPIYNPPVPFVHNLGGLYPNKMIVLSGIPHPGASRMTFNFEMSDNRNIALHFDVRFNYGNDRNIIVRNAKPGNGSWGAEERFLPYFPFSPDVFFEVMILAENDRFKVYRGDLLRCDGLLDARSLTLLCDTLLSRATKLYNVVYNTLHSLERHRQSSFFFFMVFFAWFMCFLLLLYAIKSKHS